MSRGAARRDRGTARLAPLLAALIGSIFRCFTVGARIARSHQASIQRPRRLARPRTPAFHVGNTGSNPVGDATSKPASDADASVFQASCQRPAGLTECHGSATEESACRLGAGRRGTRRSTGAQLSVQPRLDPVRVQRRRIGSNRGSTRVASGVVGSPAANTAL
jgi:hypothetical protein